MAYRTLPAPATCHPLTHAAMECTDCGAPTCESCLDFEGIGARCRPCARWAHRKRGYRRRVIQSLAVLSVAGLVIGAVAILTAKPLTAEERMQRRREFFGLTNPCLTGGPQKAKELLENGAAEVALDHAERYVIECEGSSAREMLPIRFLAHRALGRRADMVADTELALRTSPDDLFLRFWHIAALEEAGRSVEAEALLRDLAPQPPDDLYVMYRNREVMESRGFAGLSHRMAHHACWNDPCAGAATQRQSEQWFGDQLPDAPHLARALDRRCDHMSVRMIPTLAVLAPIH